MSRLPTPRLNAWGDLDLVRRMEEERRKSKAFSALAGEKPLTKADAALVRLADEYTRLDDENEALSAAEDAAPEGAAKDAIEARCKAILRRMDSIEKKMLAHPARSLAGWRAKAAVVRRQMQNGPGGEPLSSDDKLAWSLACDLLAEDAPDRR